VVEVISRSVDLPLISLLALGGYVVWAWARPKFEDKASKLEGTSF